MVYEVHIPHQSFVSVDRNVAPQSLTGHTATVSAMAAAVGDKKETGLQPKNGRSPVSWAQLGLNQRPPDYESGATNQLSYGPCIKMH